MKNHEIKFPSKNTVIKIPLGSITESSIFKKKLSKIGIIFMDPEEYDYEFINIKMKDNLDISEEQWTKFTKSLFKNCSNFTFEYKK